MAKIAILGFGTVGGGVLEVLRTSAAKVARRAGEAVEVKYILEVRDFSAHPDAALFVQDINVILSDPEITAVVETMGGVRFAYPFVKQCLESGRSVATSNKELVATHGAELLAIAKAKGCAFLFEAAVGGGMPLITPMHQCLVANEIEAVYGIVNGTTNFMLTKMMRENMGFDAALKIAQDLGYAETKDPGDDVDGRDAQRKIAILSSIASGTQIHTENIPAYGIRDITVADLAFADQLDGVIKLIAWMEQGADGTLAAGVAPMLVSKTNQLAGVEGVYNAVLLRCDMLGDVMFYGQGAGKLATASAVVADVVDAHKHGVSIHDSLFWAPTTPAEKPFTATAPAAYYMRIAGADLADISGLAGVAQLLEAPDGTLAVMLGADTTPEALAAVQAKIAALGGSVALQLKVLA